MHKRAKGNIGEDIACLFLKKMKFEIVARNYRKKWGELDIVALKSGTPHFFEVKSVTAAYAGRSFDVHRPEDNVHGPKIRHIRRMVETYLSDRGWGIDAGFHFHVLCVFMDMTARRARVKWIKDIVL
jgi:putative endonuclease